MERVDAIGGCRGDRIENGEGYSIGLRICAFSSVAVSHKHLMGLTTAPTSVTLNHVHDSFVAYTVVTMHKVTAATSLRTLNANIVGLPTAVMPCCTRCQVVLGSSTSTPSSAELPGPMAFSDDHLFGVTNVRRLLSALHQVYTLHLPLSYENLCKSARSQVGC